MKYGLILGSILLIVVDLFVYLIVGNWTNEQFASLLFINVAFLIGSFFLIISPQGINANVFRTSILLTSVTYFVIESIVGIVFINCDISMIYVVAIQSIILVVAVSILIVQHTVDKSTTASHQVCSLGMDDFFEIRDTIVDAMNKCEDRDIKRQIEKIYDRVRFMSAPMYDGVESLNCELLSLSKSLLSDVTSKNYELVSTHCTEINNVVIQREKIVRNK